MYINARIFLICRFQMRIPYINNSQRMYSAVLALFYAFKMYILNYEQSTLCDYNYTSFGV